MSEFNVGQTLYYVRDYRPGRLVRIEKVGRLVTIEKVGRKWLTIDIGIRVDKETLQVDGKGYASPGQCWLSEEEYTQYNELRNAWQTFRDRIDRYRYRTPNGVPDVVTVEKINQASALLFGE